MTASSTDIPAPRDSNTETTPFVSVVIPTYNRSQMLCDCVDSVLASTFTDFEIIIVDNASSDDTESVLQARYFSKCPKNIRYHRNPSNLMAAGGRNAGVRLARGRWMLFLDSDNLVLPDMLDQFALFTGKHPDFGLVVALSWNAFDQSVFTLGGGFNWWTGRAADHHPELYRGKSFALEDLDRAGFDDCYPTSTSCPNALFAKRTAIEQLGGFNPHYGIYFEENDLCLRAVRAGIPACICTRARTRHMCFVGDGDTPVLRRLGVGNPRSSFLLARNRSWFMKYFSPWWGKIPFFLFFVHAFCLYYVFLTLRHGHPECARAFFKGTWAGILSRPPSWP